MDCDIVRDLLPLYADGLTSESSNHLIEEHIRGCTECRRLRDEMCAPIEQVPEDKEQKILERVYRNQRRKDILFWTSVLLALVLAVWGFLEIQFNGEEIYAASTNEEKILKEMPQLALTEEELALAQTILEIPIVREAINNEDVDSTVLNSAAISPYLTSILPENGRFTEIFVFRHSVFISMIVGNRYTCLQYSDADMTGHIDAIAKTLTISPLEEIGDDGDLGDVETVYELVYAVGVGTTRCQKLRSRHIWFGFLDMP